MSSVRLDLFVEDHAHELFLRPLVARIAREESTFARVQFRVARGGSGRVINEFEIYQKTLLARGEAIPDGVVAIVDANCRGPNEVRHNLLDIVDDAVAQRTAVGCPDPHIERWYMADPPSFFTVVGVEPHIETIKCERDRYKKLLLEAIRAGGHVPTLGGLEFATELVEAMDLYRAGKREPTLRALVQDVRMLIRAARTT